MTESPLREGLYWFFVGDQLHVWSVTCIPWDTWPTGIYFNDIWCD